VAAFEDGELPSSVAEDVPGMLGLTRESVTTAVGLTKLRRLSVTEFNNTVQNLLGGAHVDYEAELPGDESMGPFVSNQTLTVGALEARKYSTVAELVADAALAAGTSFLPCALPVGDETACIEQFINEVGPRAFRRPLETSEAQALLDIYVMGRNGIEGETSVPLNGIRLLLRAIIGSPDLLYIVDTGVSGVPSEVPESASAHTLASRLSLAFWNAPPDAELLALAGSGQLLDGGTYSAQVERLLNDARAQEGVARFFAEWTGVVHLEEKEKDLSVFPQFTPELVQDMLGEQSAFVKDVVFNQGGLFSTLLTTNYAYPSAALATLYAATPDASGAISHAPGTRQGILTQAAYLAAHNKESETSPVHLGINVREAILCEVMPPPPPNVSTVLPEVNSEIRTSRDRFLLHETGPCKSCHELIDPIGLAFEHYDAIGAYRETDNGAEIDPTGQIFDANGGEPGPFFTGALELSQQLADSTQVQDCVARQALRSALDRQESVLDACTALSIIEGFDATGGNLRELLTQIAHTEAFKNIVLNPPESSQ
jgi:hypothetical protein